MDSLSQLALGAAVSEAMIGKKVGRKASVWGAVLGTFPDLDVFIPMGSSIADFVYHRSFSHSFLILGLCAPLWAWFIARCHQHDSGMRKSWFAVCLAVFYTHILLDSITIYGTQIFWPFSSYPISIGSIFIVDPIYTLPLLFGVLVYLTSRKTFGYRANIIGLGISTLYLLWTMTIQAHVRSITLDNLQRNNLPWANVLVTPTPFNSFLWRLVSIDQNGYHVGYFSIFDESKEIPFRFISSSYEMVDSLNKDQEVQDLMVFTHGFFTIDRRGNDWVVSDIRMGVEPGYVFQFAVAQNSDAGIKFIEPYRYPPPRNLGRLGSMLERIFDERIPMLPAND